MSRLFFLLNAVSVMALAPLSSGAAEAVFRLDGAAQEILFGSSVVVLGDVDGDGVPEFAVGAPQTLGPGGGYLDGQVLVYSGATQGLLYVLDPLRHRGFFGARLAVVGDLDGDGVPELIVGAPATSSDDFYGVGSALVFSGAGGKLRFEFLGAEGGTYSGSAVAGAGAEILIGTPYGTGDGPYGGGVVSVRSGLTGALRYEFNGDDSGDYLGSAVAALGDVDADGVADYGLGAPNASPDGLAQAGLVEIRSGATGEVLAQLNGGQAGAFFGQAIANVGDLDGDGVDDFAVGAPSATLGDRQHAGSVFVYSGATLERLYRWDGDSRLDTFGAAIAGGVDIDGDGVPDLVVGAPDASPGGLRGAGSAFAFSGSTGQLLFRWDGDEADAALGWSVAIAGDLQLDGRVEILIGAPRANPGKRGAGSVFGVAF